MKLIKTPKGLKGYIPGSSFGTFEKLKEEHPDIKLYKTAIRKSDGQKFKAGQWVKLKSGETEKIIAFDHYDYPLPLNKKDKPIGQLHENGFISTFYKAKFQPMIRFAYYSAMDFIFCDIEEYKGLNL